MNKSGKTGKAHNALETPTVMQKAVAENSHVVSICMQLDLIY